jgi:hypothetical protein
MVFIIIGAIAFILYTAYMFFIAVIGVCKLIDEIKENGVE